jgi:predicted transglutaminase-like protease
MIKSTYKPGKDIYAYKNKNKNKNNYYQAYWNAKLCYKGYVKNDKYIGYQEDYRYWMNKGIKYIL